MVLEVTETAVIRNEAAASAFLARMRELGCRVALDDFGTGYSGFRHMRCSRRSASTSPRGHHLGRPRPLREAFQTLRVSARQAPVSGPPGP